MTRPSVESGQPTPKFVAFRDAITRVTGKTPPAIPSSIPARAYPIHPHPTAASLWQNLPKPVESDKLLTMEDLDPVLRLHPLMHPAACRPSVES